MLLSGVAPFPCGLQLQVAIFLCRGTEEEIRKAGAHEFSLNQGDVDAIVTMDDVDATVLTISFHVTPIESLKSSCLSFTHTLSEAHYNVHVQ